MSCNLHFEKHHSRMRTKTVVLIMIQLDPKRLFLSLFNCRKHVIIDDCIAWDTNQFYFVIDFYSPESFLLRFLPFAFAEDFVPTWQLVVFCHTVGSFQPLEFFLPSAPSLHKFHHVSSAYKCPIPDMNSGMGRKLRPDGRD